MKLPNHKRSPCNNNEDKKTPHSSLVHEALSSRFCPVFAPPLPVKSRAMVAKVAYPFLYPVVMAKSCRSVIALQTS